MAGRDSFDAIQYVPDKHHRDLERLCDLLLLTGFKLSAHRTVRCSNQIFSLRLELIFHGVPVAVIKSESSVGLFNETLKVKLKIVVERFHSCFVMGKFFCN
jgi:hypothetical protein